MKEKMATLILGIFSGSWVYEFMPEPMHRMVLLIAIIGTIIAIMAGNKISCLLGLLLQSMSLGAVLTYFSSTWGEVGPAVCKVILLVMTFVLVVYLGKYAQKKPQAEEKNDE